MCLYVDDWVCKFEGEEIPLKVCKTCIKARKVANEIKVEGKTVEGIEPGEVREGSEKMREERSMVEALQAGSLQAEEGKKIEEERSIKEQIEAGYMYMLEDEDGSRSFELLEDLITEDKKMMVITRKHPKKIEKEYDIDLEDEESVWLSTRNDDLSIDPKQLDTLGMEIEMFLSEGGDLIFIEGLDYLLSHNQNSLILQFFQSIEDQVTTSEAAMVFTIPPSRMEEEHLTIVNKLDLNRLEKPAKKTKVQERERKPIAESMGGKSAPPSREIRLEKEFKEEDRKTKMKALKELDEEFHKGEIDVDEYLSKRSVLAEPISESEGF